MDDNRCLDEHVAVFPLRADIKRGYKNIQNIRSPSSNPTRVCLQFRPRRLESVGNRKGVVVDLLCVRRYMWTTYLGTNVINVASMSPTSQ